MTATSALVRARYHPSQCQILTLATDGQVSYFEVIDGTEIRNIVLGKHSTVTSLDVSPGQGENFITSTNDSLVKVITITICTVGQKIKKSPDQKTREIKEINFTIFFQYFS